jgi:cardiolipin synthase (CMP-forming)
MTSPEGAREKLLNIPNALSLYRLTSFPFLLWLAWTGHEHPFAVLFSINLITDLLDGLIARLTKTATQFGARLDSLADFTTWLLAIYAIGRFHWPEMHPSSGWLAAVIVTWLATYAVAFAKFRRFPTLHLYSSKAAAYVQGIFFFVLFNWGLREGLFIAAVTAALGSCVEEICVLLMFKEMRADSRGLYWLMKKDRK